MDTDARSASSRPPSGGVIRLQARLTNPTTWLGPAWACLCGVVASGRFGWQGQDWLRLALLILLVDGGWGTLWAALGGTDWATPLRRWRNWRFGKSIATLPYTLPGSPAAHASRWLGELSAWWRDILWLNCSPALSAIIVALPVTAALGAVLGPRLLLLSVATLAVMQLSLAWKGGRGTMAPGWDSATTAALPWLAGHVAFGSLGLRSAALAAIFALAWGGAWQVASAWGRRLAVGSQLSAAALLVVSHHPLAATLLLLLVAPQVALLPWLHHGQPASWYVRHSRPWLMGAMLLAAWAL